MVWLDIDNIIAVCTDDVTSVFGNFFLGVSDCNIFSIYIYIV